jgi:hypothetical protein
MRRRAAAESFLALHVMLCSAAAKNAARAVSGRLTNAIVIEAEFLNKFRSFFSSSRDVRVGGVIIMTHLSVGMPSSASTTAGRTL